MGWTDMSPEAVTLRLLRTEQLRRLCLALRRRTRDPDAEGAPTEQPTRRRLRSADTTPDPSLR